MDKYHITEKNIPAHEWNGLQAVVQTTAGKKQSWAGTIVWETKNTIELETGSGVKKIPKKIARITFDWDGKKMVLEAKDWIARPEDRVKLWWRKNA